MADIKYTDLSGLEHFSDTIKSILDNKANTSSLGSYYTKAQVDNLLTGKSDTHSHPYASSSHNHDGTYLKKYSYSVPSGKAIRVTYSTNALVIVSMTGTNQGSQLILIGTGYGEGGNTRNRWTELTPASHFPWSVPQVDGISRSVEIKNNRVDNSDCKVYSDNDIVFTEIDALTTTAQAGQFTLAKISDIPSLSGYATQDWVNNKEYTTATGHNHDSSYYKANCGSIPTSGSIAALSPGSYWVYENKGNTNPVKTIYSSLSVLGNSYYSAQLNVKHDASQAWLRGIYNTSDGITASDWHELAFTDSNISGTADKAKQLIDSSSGAICAHTSDLSFYVGDNIYPNKSLELLGKTISLRYGANANTAIYINNNGNVTLGSSNLATTNYKTFINGNLAIRDTSKALNLSADKIWTTAIVEIGSLATRNDGLYIGQYANSLMWMQNAYGGDDTNKSSKHPYPISIQPIGGNIMIGTTNDFGQTLQVHGGALFNRYNATGNTSGASIIVNKGGTYFGLGPSKTSVSHFGLGTVKDNAGNWDKEIITIHDNGYTELNGTLSITSSIPSYFTAVGNGTYNKAVIEYNENGFVFERARKTDSSNANIIPLIISQRGGGTAAKFDANNLYVTGGIYSTGGNITTTANANPFKISRDGNNNTEVLNIGVNDMTAFFTHVQDETVSDFLFTGKFTDSESGGGKNAGEKSIRFALSSGDHNIYVGSTAVSLNGHTHTKLQITDFPSSLPASDVHAWAKKASLDANDLPAHTHSYLPLAGGTMESNAGIKWPQSTSSTWDTFGHSTYQGLKLLNTIGSSSTNAPNEYAVGLSVSGYYGFCLSYYGGGNIWWLKGCADSNWKTILHSDNSSVSGGGSTWGSSITVKVNDTSKTLTIPNKPTYTASDVGAPNIAHLSGGLQYQEIARIDCSSNKNMLIAIRGTNGGRGALVYVTGYGSGTYVRMNHRIIYSAGSYKFYYNGTSEGGAFYVYNDNTQGGDSFSVTELTGGVPSITKVSSLPSDVLEVRDTVALTSHTHTSFSDDITVTGKVSASSGFFQTSDERRKDFHDDIDVDFDKLRAIPKKYFSWKSDENKEIHLGTSAQAVQEIYPELVSESDGTLSVAYDKLSIIALKAVDELYTKNQELEERLKRIEKMLNI